MLLKKGKTVKRSEKYSAKKLALCAMLSALGVILLYAGSLIEIVDISMAVVASLTCVIAVIEYGGSAPWMIYGVTSILSLLLLPNKAPAALYAIFFGFYPILKEKLEKKSKLLSWILKEIVFNFCLVIMVVVDIFLLGLVDNSLINPITLTVGAIVVEAVFVLYDIALTRLISYYIIRLRSRFKFK